ncbi:phage tail-collar fiber domain-containing protein [Desulfoluna spongiiphila]|uniref:phage tail-collar fiber domain-containing protein n=1 Tax=Desulfoluna spongiiphila TaxID=419481 RepID=UPI00125992FB|nr:phage tail protein [Desulfoluna spongiiphila]VVS91075.1 phage tail fibre protein [Desulfoluna spongiiphila]
MSSAITALGQTRINQLRGEEKPLVIDRMVLALVPGLDPSQPVDRNQQMPDPAHVVHTHTIDDAHKGYVNPDQVVYSMILGSDVGDFSFNWIGTVEAVTGNVITVTTTPETPKRKTDLGSNTTGNNITRNVMMQFQDAQALTGVSVSAETWQFDYTTWMTARIEEHDGDGGAHGDIRNNVKALFNHGIGKIDFFDCEVPPAGWLEANGSECPEAASGLNTLIAGRHGVGPNGRSLLPDSRGEFVRGWDNGRGVDSGRDVGTPQGDAIRNIKGTWDTNADTSEGVSYAHNSRFTGALYKSSENASKLYGPESGKNNLHLDGIGFDASRVVPTAEENRPRNVAFLVCIYAGI